MTEPPQPVRPAEAVNPYENTPTWQGPSSSPATPQPFAPWVPPASEHPEASTVLLLGVLGIFTLVTGPFAFVIGQRARAEVAEGRYAPSGSLNVGWALGLVASVILALLVLLFGLGVVGLLAFRSA